MTADSRLRKPSSPSFSKINAISTPVRDSISSSLSTKLRCSLRAICRPTADLPAPIGPMRNIFFGWVIVSFYRSLKQKANPKVGFPIRRELLSLVDAGPFLKDAGRHEDQQFGLVLCALFVTEQCAGKRDIAEERYLVDRLATFSLIDTAE